METITKITRAEIVERVLYALQMVTISKYLTQTDIDAACAYARKTFNKLYEEDKIELYQLCNLGDLLRREVDCEFYGIDPLPTTKRERAKLVRKALK